MENKLHNYDKCIEEFKSELSRIDSLLSTKDLIIDNNFLNTINIFFINIEYLFKLILSFNLSNEDLKDIIKYRHKYLTSIIKKIENLKTNDITLIKLINFIKWLPYKVRYISNAFTIFFLLKEVEHHLNIYNDILLEIIDKNMEFINSASCTYIDLINGKRLIISSCLRYCLEIVVKSFVNNNVNYLKNETNIKTHSFEGLIKTLNNKKYDYSLKTVDIENSDINNKYYFYYRSNFWEYKNLTKNYDYLSNNSHYRPNKDPNVEIEKLHNLPEKNDIAEDFEKLKKIYFEFIDSFKNHIIYFENGDYKLMVEIEFDDVYSVNPIKIKYLDDCKVSFLEK